MSSQERPITGRLFSKELSIDSANFPQFAGNYLFWAAIFVVGFALLGIFLTTDGTPDFKIYHYYNGFAALHDRSKLDIFPAQMQTSVFNAADPVYYSLFKILNNHPGWLNVILSLPYSAAAFLIYLIARNLIGPAFYARNFVAAAAAFVGMTGAAALPTFATTMSEVLPDLPFLAAVALWVSFEKADRNDVRTSVLVGALAGLSVGLKLTAVSLFIGLFCAIAIRRALAKPMAFREAFAFGLAGVAVFISVDLSWLWHNFVAYQNPIFPFENNVFRSPLITPQAWNDTRFFPKTFLMTLFYPAYWAFAPSHDAIELNMRDPRILLGWMSAILIIATFVVRRLRRGSAAPAVSVIEALSFCLSIAYLVSYVVWERNWSIYRYLTGHECLSAVMVLAAIITLTRGRIASQWLVAIFAVILAWPLTSTEYPWWSRAQRGPLAVSVKLPPIEPNAMVVFLDPYAYSYLVPSMPPTVRAIGANSNLVGPGRLGTLVTEIEAAVRNHQGPLWGMEYPQAFPGVADTTLTAHHLERTGDCYLVDTNIEEKPIVKVCRLKRM